jgi:hypothetical protein
MLRQLLTASAVSPILNFYYCLGLTACIACQSQNTKDWRGTAFLKVNIFV